MEPRRLVVGRRRLAAAALLFAIGSTVAGCGGGSGETARFSMITGELRDDRERAGFALEGEELTSPGPTIRVPLGAEVTITLENQHGEYFGEEIPHDIMIVADRSATPPEPLFEGADMELLESGRRGSITFTADESGSFFYICSVAGHLARGMYGEFVVE